MTTPARTYAYTLADGSPAFTATLADGVLSYADAGGNPLAIVPACWYRWPELAARKGEPVVVVSGERHAETLVKLGIGQSYAITCLPVGCCLLDAMNTGVLDGRPIIFVADAVGDNGREWDRQGMIAAALWRTGKSFRIVDARQFDANNVSDWANANSHRLGELPAEFADAVRNAATIGIVESNGRASI